MTAIQDLVREVAESRSVTEGAVALIAGLQKQLADLAASGLTQQALEEQIAALAAELDAQQKNLTAAMTTGTVADPSQPAPDNGIENAPNVEPEVPPAETIATEAADVGTPNV